MIRYDITLKYDGAQRIPANWAYQLYSALLERVDGDYVDQLHLSGFTPVHQYLRCPDAGTCVWVVCLLTGDAQSHFAPAVESLDRIDVKPQNVTLLRTGINKQQIDPLRNHVSEVRIAQDVTRLHFLTPTTFKTDGRYALFPSEKLILQSMVNRWNACNDTYRIEDEDAFGMLLSGIRIQNYSLHLNRFPLKATVLNGFCGYVDIRSSLPAPLKSVWAQLLELAPACGIGIKTSLGMGAVAVEYPPFAKRIAL